MKKIARITYHKDEEKNREEYRIELYDEEYNEWGLDTAYQFRRCDKDAPDQDANWLHFDIVSKLLSLINNGYKIYDKR